jgi:hypothetical protein
MDMGTMEGKRGNLELAKQMMAARKSKQVTLKDSKETSVKEMPVKDKVEFPSVFKDDVPSKESSRRASLRLGQPGQTGSKSLGSGGAFLQKLQQLIDFKQVNHHSHLFLNFCA